MSNAEPAPKEQERVNEVNLELIRTVPSQEPPYKHTEKANTIAGHVEYKAKSFWNLSEEENSLLGVISDDSHLEKKLRILGRIAKESVDATEKNNFDLKTLSILKSSLDKKRETELTPEGKPEHCKSQGEIFKIQFVRNSVFNKLYETENVAVITYSEMLDSKPETLSPRADELGNLALELFLWNYSGKSFLDNLKLEYSKYTDNIS